MQTDAFAPLLPKATTKGQLRRVLGHRRRVIPEDLADTTRWKVMNHLRTLVARQGPGIVALYHPLPGEIDLLPLVWELWGLGYGVALPRVVYRGHPLTFNLWQEGTALERDALGIPAATGAEVVPAMLVIPMVGYTRNGHRLGSGTGYYDKTLEAWPGKVVTVGVCQTELEMPHFPAETHDRRMDMVVTGKEVIFCNN